VAETPAFVKENKMDQAFDEKLHVEEMLETKVLKEEGRSSPEFVDYDPMTIDPQEDEEEHQNGELLSCKEEHEAAEEQHMDSVGMYVGNTFLFRYQCQCLSKLKRESRVETVVCRKSDPISTLKSLLKFFILCKKFNFFQISTAIFFSP
jgi:hypothetical protein